MLIFLYAVGCIVFTTVGQIFLKLGSSKGIFYKNVHTYIGYSCFLIVLPFAYLLLKIIEMKYFVTVMSINYVSVTIASTFFFNDKLTLNKVLGSIIVAAGVVIFTVG